jgi:hypothetical protein
MRLDAGVVRLGATPTKIHANGAREYRGVASYGDVVLEYGPNDPGGQRNEFVPADVALAPEVLADAVGLPFTVIHPGEMLSADDEEAMKDHTEGTVLRASANWEADPPEMLIDVVVLTRSAQQAIESGEMRELSLGYDCQDELRPGNFKGKTYDRVQRRRRMNHLSAVRTARSTTPDGRRARLDSQGATYAHPGEKMDDDVLVTPTDAARTDAEVVVEPAPAADPLVAALAMFSPEAVEILKTLPEADMEALKALVVTQQGENAEQAVIAAAGADAPAPVIEVGGEEESEGEKVDDATVPAAPQALTADAVQQMIDAAMAKMAGGKMDGTKPVTVKPTASAPRVDEAEVARRAAAIVDSDRTFVDHVRQCGHRCDSLKSAHEAALAVIQAHAPRTLAAAQRALKDGRRDDFAAMFDAAEDVRRADFLSDQFAVMDAAQHSIASDRLAQPARISAPDRALPGA